MCDDQIAMDSEMHGKIIVTLVRGHLAKLGHSKMDGNMLWDQYDAPDTKISSKTGHQR